MPTPSLAAEPIPQVHPMTPLRFDHLAEAIYYVRWLRAHRATHRCPLRCALLELSLALGRC